jgi:hypothetical protein
MVFSFYFIFGDTLVLGAPTSTSPHCTSTYTSDEHTLAEHINVKIKEKKIIKKHYEGDFQLFPK